MIAIDCLSSIQKKVICLYYGINTETKSFDNKSLPLSTISAQTDIPIQKLEQLLDNAHTKIKQNIEGDI
jgi:hypothetical protein